MGSNTKPVVANQKRVDLYIDESGQDTRGRLFIVAVVAVEDSDKLRQLCESFEETSGKRKKKWASSERSRRLDYLRAVIQKAATLNVTLFYSVFRKRTDYDAATIDGIAKAILRLSPSNSHVYVYVDGLAKAKRSAYKTGLRQLGFPVKKVIRVSKDENEPLIRLADALAGAAGELLKHQAPDLETLFSEAKQRGSLVEL
ncbi:hypothetical protein C6503_09655 [Candidatus Poribacteria bacterium]|nr:MAG: hypothetical protein C6503_09655 [Candidatus Poribacteria bacterium]